MDQKLESLKKIVISASQQPNFKHRLWFVKWHLEIVVKISQELLAFYPNADADVVVASAWLHDYGKAFGKDKSFTISAGSEVITKCGYDSAFVNKVSETIKHVDAHKEFDIAKTPIEAQIVSSADGCAHLVGPFMRLFWFENPDWTIDSLLLENQRKLNNDWELKICLPEARKAFALRKGIQLEAAGIIPETYL